MHISIKTNHREKEGKTSYLSFYQISSSYSLLCMEADYCRRIETVITIKIGTKEEKAEAYKIQNCNSWGIKTRKAVVTLIPAADDPGSP